MALTKITSTNIQPGAIEASSLETSGATAGTYGAAAKIPVLSVNAQGIVYAISEVDVAGVTGFTYNSGTEALTITTADGGSFTADISTLASQSYVDTALSNLVDTAPTTLDTLNELAAALGDDPNFATTVATSIGTKVDKINITGATVGSASQVPVITFNAQGQITAATTTAVAGVSGTSFTNGTYTISTSDGGTYPTDFDARYFTETEAQANFLGINAKAVDSDLLDGLNSTQFLRSDQDVSLAGNLTINKDSGAFQINGANYISAKLYDGGTGDPGYLALYYNGSQKVSLGAGANYVLDNFGIGVNNPTSILHVESGGSKWTFGTTPSSPYNNNSNGFWSNAGNISLANRWATFNLPTDYTDATSTSAWWMLGRSSGDTTFKLNLRSGYTTSGGNDRSFYEAVPDSTGINANLSYQRWFGASNVEALRINASGYVGVGNSNPQYKLHVLGHTVANVTNTSPTDGAGDARNDGFGFKVATNGADVLGALINSSANGNWGANLHFNVRNSGGGTFPATPAMTIKSDTGNVGIGTSSPNSQLHVNGRVFVGDGFTQVNQNYTLAQMTLGGLHNAGYNAGTGDGVSNGFTKLLISGVDNDGPTYTLKYIRCEDENGIINYDFYGPSESTGRNAYARFNANIYFDWDIQNNVGSITRDANGTTYNTTSDRRLKENIVAITDGKEKLLAMKPCEFSFIADEDHNIVTGFIAQEMKEVVPEAVTGDPDSDEMMSMDYGRITPVIVAALQDALKEIEELKERIKTLEAK